MLRPPTFESSSEDSDGSIIRLSLSKYLKKIVLGNKVAPTTSKLPELSLNNL